MEDTHSEIGLESFSILHKGFRKLYPILSKLEDLLIKEKEDPEKPVGSLFEKSESRDQQRTQVTPMTPEEKEAEAHMKQACASEELNMQNMLGFINQKKINASLNISNIMRLKRLTFSDLYKVSDLDTILLRDSMLQRVTMIITSYFCLGTELRFLKQMKLQGFKDSLEAQSWHGRSLEMALCFLPGDSPLVKHIIQSYNKHHAPSNQAIPEDEEVA